MKWEKALGNSFSISSSAHIHMIFFNKNNWWYQPGFISYSVWLLSKRTPYSSAICRLEAWCGWIGDVILLCAIFSFFLSIEAEELMYIGYTGHKVRKNKVHYQCWHIIEIYQIRNSRALSCIGHLSFLKAGEYAQKKVHVPQYDTCWGWHVDPVLHVSKCFYYFLFGTRCVTKCRLFLVLS
jgi:hypothetical protein